MARLPERGDCVGSEGAAGASENMVVVAAAETRGRSFMVWDGMVVAVVAVMVVLIEVVRCVALLRRWKISVGGGTVCEGASTRGLLRLSRGCAMPLRPLTGRHELLPYSTRVGHEWLPSSNSVGYGVI